MCAPRSRGQLGLTRRGSVHSISKSKRTVSNTAGRRGVVTMYNGSSSAVIHAVPPDPSITSGAAHTKVFSP
jgi:hypothetical protein